MLPHIKLYMHNDAFHVLLSSIQTEVEFTEDQIEGRCKEAHYYIQTSYILYEAPNQQRVPAYAK